MSLFLLQFPPKPNYRKEHPNFSQVECNRNLGIDTTTLAKWEALFQHHDNATPVRDSNNY